MGSERIESFKFFERPEGVHFGARNINTMARGWVWHDQLGDEPLVSPAGGGHVTSGDPRGSDASACWKELSENGIAPLRPS